MRNLASILNPIKGLKITGEKNLELQGLAIDNRKVEQGFLFAAMRGTATDGHLYIPAAIAAGASCILCEIAPEKQPGITYIESKDVAGTLGAICNEYFDRPSGNIILCGVTGTNGKTTVTSLLFELFSKRGNACGLISTVEYRIGQEVFPSTHTTPDIISLYSLIDRMVQAGCTYCFMEVSSHALHQQRVAGLEFAGAVFTNISHDHLDYHGTFDEYIKAKKSFFDDLPSSAWALTNKDDKNGMLMLQNSKASRYTYSMRSNSDFRVRILESDFQGTLLQIDNKDVWVSLVGEFNAYNLAAVYGAAFLLLGGDENLAVEISDLHRVKGRFEALAGPNKISAIVDYAHTPDALQNVIETINGIRANNAHLITVFGCGGNRDKEKRPEMGRIASRLSNTVIITSDNPRGEDPEAIMDEIEKGVEAQHYKKILRVADRKQAIRTAVKLAKPGDVILVAGKGHENYQEIAGVKHPFDDVQVLTESFNQIR